MCNNFHIMVFIVILHIIVLACLAAVAWIDYKTMMIPDQLSIAIAVCGVIAVFLIPDIGLASRLLGIAAAAAPIFIIAFFVEGAFGFGDVKLMAAAGLFLGWQNALVALFIGVVTGGVCGAFLLAAKKKTGKDHFAFGPALCTGVGAAMFAGNEIIGWYFCYF